MPCDRFVVRSLLHRGASALSLAREEWGVSRVEAPCCTGIVCASRLLAVRGPGEGEDLMAPETLTRAQTLVHTIRDDLRPVEQQLRQHPYLHALETGRLRPSQ